MYLSKLYNIYVELKKQNSKTIYIFKSGIFFIALDEDAIKLSKLFNFKISNFTPSVIKCGFPCSSLEKYEKLFKACNLTVKIIEPEKKISYALTDYKENSHITSILNSIKCIDINNLSIQEAYNFLESLQNEIQKIDL